MRKLQAQIDKLEKQRAGDYKWITETARRVDGIEAQARAQTREAMDYALAKCREVDAQLRAELAAGVPDLVAVLDKKFEKEMPVLFQASERKMDMAMAALEAKWASAISGKFAERVDALDQAVKAQQQVSEAHQAYLKARADAKPGEEQTLVSYFQYLDEEVNKLKGMQAGSPDPAQAQKIFNETKGLVYQMGLDIRKEYEHHLGSTRTTAAQHQHNTDEHFKTVDAEIAMVKAALASGGSVSGQAPSRGPPGFSGLNLRGAYAAGAQCGATGGPCDDTCGAGVGHGGAGSSHGGVGATTGGGGDPGGGGGDLRGVAAG